MTSKKTKESLKDRVTIKDHEVNTILEDPKENLFADNRTRLPRTLRRILSLEPLGDSGSSVTFGSKKSSFWLFGDGI